VTARVLAPGRKGRKPCLPAEVGRRILAMRRQGLSLQEIASRLNAEGISRPLSGEPWRKKHVYQVLGCLYMRDLEEDLSGNRVSAAAMPRKSELSR